MSTALRWSVGSMATRKVIGWSLPSTLPTAAKPSSESARETRSTLAVSTRSVSTRAPEPNNRAHVRLARRLLPLVDGALRERGPRDSDHPPLRALDRYRLRRIPRRAFAGHE